MKASEKMVDEATTLAAQIPADWRCEVDAALHSPAWRDLACFLAAERAAGPIFPPPECVFNALHLTPFAAVRVVILGQDPYHDDGQAHGLAFSVPPGVKPPPSLRNIMKELREDLGTASADTASGDLTAWARQGCLLLNTVLTVRAHQAHSHKGHWEFFTDAIIRALNARPAPALFLLWGGPAQAKRPLIDESRHQVLASAHPSPLSAYRGFLGSRPFSTINAALTLAGHPPIDWGMSAATAAPPQPLLSFL